MLALKPEALCSLLEENTDLAVLIACCRWVCLVAYNVADFVAHGQVQSVDLAASAGSVQFVADQAFESKGRLPGVVVLSSQLDGLLLLGCDMPDW